MCGISREPQSERLPLFDGYESACTTFVATFPRVRPTGLPVTSQTLASLGNYILLNEE